MNGLSFGRTVIVLVGIYFLRASSKILRKYKNKLTSELLNKDIPPGKWWRIAKSISNFTKARDPPPFLEHDGQIFIHPSNKVEILNTHFSSVMINSFK
jgi:hypothetical protein